MEASIVKKEQIIYVNGDVNFKSARDLHLQSRLLLNAEPEWRIDFSSVTSFNSAMLALMIEWIRQAKQGNKKLTFQAIPPAVLSIAKVAGLTALLGSFLG